MIVDTNGIEVSDSARYSGPFPICELEAIESEERWDDLVEDEIWFQQHEAEMRANVRAGISF